MTVTRTIFILLLPLFSLGQGEPIKNLVFEGGGIRGIAYCGALEELENQGMLDAVERVGGASAGAITATFLSVGYSAKEIQDIIFFTDFSDFNDGQYMFVGGASRMVDSYGWYKGEAFVGWLESHIARKTGDKDITFGELHAQKGELNSYDLYVAGTNLTLQQPVIFSHENYPDMRVADAVRISMAVPFWFEAVGIDQAGKILAPDQWDQNTSIMIDGGLLTNFPLHIFDDPKYYSGASLQAFDADFRNPQTVGLRLDTDEQIETDLLTNGQLAPQQIENIEDYTVALYTMVIENLNRSQLNQQDWYRTISISSLDIGPRVKELSDQQKDSLIMSGKEGVIQFCSAKEE